MIDQNDLTLAETPGRDFACCLMAYGCGELRPAELEVLQLNVGRLCNMTCRHCHLDAGPHRRGEVMSRATMDACLAALDRTSVNLVDVTGGAPELNPDFRYLVRELVARGVHVIDRCNLTVLLEPGMEDLPRWLGELGVEVVASLPHHRPRNVDAQRGSGTFARSLEALARLNRAGYGQGDPRRQLVVMVNPAGAFLAGNQCGLEGEWKESLRRDHGVTFDRLTVLNNIPLGRFLEWLEARGQAQTYLQRLVSSFNPATVQGAMCRRMVSVAWDGRLYDCDFNLACDLPPRLGDGQGDSTIFSFDPHQWGERTIATATHCFACTAGSGSSCGGATVD
jgi:radical SAM/Cys-rich protein